MSAKITFETPVIKDETGKPMALANQPFPFNQVSSDRRFEELIYSIYKRKIENDSAFADTHDAIKLMQGVGEKGRDCVLYKNGVINAAIQCKKYNTRITKPDCAKELIKFVLFSMLDSALLPSLNNFTYYFIASSDFTEPASTFLDDLGNTITTEAELKPWTEEVIKKYKSFAGIDYKTVEAKLVRTLSSLKIKQVIPRDLDIELNMPYSSDIITLFFEAKNVFDTRTVEDLMETLTNKKVSLTEQQIIQKFETASLQLSSYKSELSNLTGSHIERGESKEILAWINSPLQEKHEPILLLVGDPGLGKSVILKDVYDNLVSSKIPVAGIKCDRYYVSSIGELSTKMNLDYSIIDLARKLMESNKQVVFLIDQIDSLSQAVTTKRDYIDTYNKILHELQRIPGIRVVISIRTFDLTYDYEFTHYRQLKKITVNTLSKPQITPVLNKLGIVIEELSENLMLLLSVPNHLDIFCKIFSPGFNTDQIATVTDLYDELWKQKVSVTAVGNAIENQNALYEISQKLHTQQTLIISTGQLSDAVKARLAYLTSCGLIDAQESEIQFFHQSFHDYVFARHFNEKEISVVEYINAENQSLYIRPALKMILTSLRTKDHPLYLKTITELLFSGSIRLHIQLLVLNQLSFEPRPNAAEKAFLLKRILASAKYRMPFLESAASGGWFETLVSCCALDSLIQAKPTWFESFCENKNVKKSTGKIGMAAYLSKFEFQKRLAHESGLWYKIMRRALGEQPKAALQYLDRLGDFPDKRGMIIRLLTFVKSWDEPLARKLFDQHYDHDPNSWFELDQVIGQASQQQFNWCLNLFITYCFDSFVKGQYHDHTMIAHYKHSIAKKLFTVNREETFLFAIGAVRSIIEHKASEYSIDTKVLYDDIVFINYDEESSNNGEFHEMLYKDCMETGRQLATEKSPYLNDFLKSVPKENSIGIIKVMLYALEGNPGAYRNEIFALLERLYVANAFYQGPKYYIRNLISACFTSLTPMQQQMLIDNILSIRSENEMFKREISNKMKFVSWYGRLQFEYLSSIPEDALKSFPAALKKMCELKRRFKKAENKRDFAFSCHIIGAPLAASAYESMQLDQWESSFLKYDKENDSHTDGFKGGLTEHCRAFEEQVEKRPSFFISFIDKIITVNKVKVDYMIAGIGGLIKANYDPKLVFNLYKKLIKIPMPRFAILQSMWMVHYLSNHRMVDQEIFDYVCEVALNDKHPETELNPTKPEFDMLNTNRGAATDVVVRCWFNPDFADRIFDVLEKIGRDPIISVRLSAMRHMGYLMHLDKEKTLQLFLSYTGNTTDSDLYKFSIDAAQYLAKYNFKAMLPYFKKAVEIESVQGNIAILLSLAWIHDEEGAFALLELLWKKSDMACSKMVDVAINNYNSHNSKTKEKCKWLYLKFLNNESKEVIHEYTSAFLHLKPGDFLQFYPLLKRFSVSSIAIKDPHYFYDYLIKCCKQFPVQCIDLFVNFKKYNEPNPFTGPYYDGSEPVKILIGSYNGLYETLPLNRKYVIKAMDSFDIMLKKPVFRNAAHQVLNTI